MESFEYTSGVWKAVWRTRKDINFKLFVLGDADFMQTQSISDQLQVLKNTIEVSIDNASTFASGSEYRDVVCLAAGIVVDSVVVTRWDDIKIWFTLQGSGGMIGVRLYKDEPVDVFCDH